jgi:hypothetical protein
MSTIALYVECNCDDVAVLLSCTAVANLANAVSIRAHQLNATMAARQ